MHGLCSVDYYKAAIQKIGSIQDQPVFFVFSDDIAWAEKNLEIYFNGERGLTEFMIDCYKQNGTHWQKIGKYTPDFLVINRKANKIHQALIIETKGAGFAKDFAEKRSFMQGAFLHANPEFEFLYLQEDSGDEKNLRLFHDKVTEFFGVAA